MPGVSVINAMGLTLSVRIGPLEYPDKKTMTVVGSIPHLPFMVLCMGKDGKTYVVHRQFVEEAIIAAASA